MKLFDKIAKLNFVWSFAIYATEGLFTPDLKLGDPVRLFNSRRLRLFGVGPHTQADPFMLVEGDQLFIFYEKMERGGVGEIACVKTDDLQSFHNCGVVLSEPHHLSWPFVFRWRNYTYMVPESGTSGLIALYRFNVLPNSLEMVRTLRTGDYADPILIEQDGLWYLFATSDHGLELFVAPDLLQGKFEPHPRSPITTDLRFSRSGGPPMLLDGRWVRVAQDCSRTYGENVSLIEISRLTPTDYQERLIRPSFFELKHFWNRLGAHHLSVVEFNGRTVIAADGKHSDYWVNRLFPTARTNRTSK